PAGLPSGRTHALVRPSARLLRLRDLGRADDQLPAAAPDAGQSDRRPAAAPEPGTARREPGPDPDLRGAPRRRSPLDLAGLRHVPAPGRALRLRHLDLELPDAGIRGRRPHAAVLDLPRRR